MDCVKAIRGRTGGKVAVRSVERHTYAYHSPVVEDPVRVATCVRRPAIPLS